MIIQHNLLAMNNLYSGKQIQKSKAKVTERLSSGYRINRAADDAANMAISEKMTARIRSLNRCQNNIEEGISLTQTADGALNEVNDMLNRVHELCVQAANGTNTDSDRMMISDEITQIYDDMDRIFETTEFNTIPVFRYDGDNYYGAPPQYNYIESATELPPPDNFSEWGDASFPTKVFDIAQPAKAATANLTLKPGVDMSDASSLDGTFFTISKGSTVYKVQFGTEQSTGFNSGNVYINTITYSTVQAALDRVVYYFGGSYSSSYNFLDDVQLNGNNATFTFKTKEESRTISFSDDTNGDGIEEATTAIEKVQNGTVGNGYTFSCSGNILNPVDSSNQKLTYGTTITQDLKILSTRADSSTLTAIEKENLKKNKLSLYPNGSLEFATAINVDSISTVGQLRQAIADAINAQNNFTASYDSANRTIQVKLSGRSGTSGTYSYISESITSTTTDLGTTSSFSVNVTQTQTATAEKKAIYSITIPAVSAKDTPYSIAINGKTYTMYNSANYSGNGYDSIYSSNGSTSTRTDVTAYVAAKIKEIYAPNNGGNFDLTQEVTNGDGSITITLMSKQLNDNSGIRISQATTTLHGRSSSDTVLAISPSASYYSQDYSVALDIKESVGDSFDTTALYGKGFCLNNQYYQFTGTGDTNALYSTSTHKINLDGVTSYSDLCSKLAASTGFTVTESSTTSGTILLQNTKLTSSSSSSSANFSDGGPQGTFAATVTSSGGTAYKNPQAEIDFSKYSMENLDELYGTGFRITCATCPGEFINVMFCHDKSSFSYPASFEYTDENGNTNTIHNYMVELKDVTHGKQIAANIVEQLKDDLDHFTEVTVSDSNPSILIAQDKRSKDQPGRAEIISGVYTNFLYHLKAEKIPDKAELVDRGRKGTDAYYAYCMIYASDTEEKPYIPIHLPYLTLDNLNIEYPDDAFKTTDGINNIMTRSQTAAVVISMARSQIGADQNRLEHAFTYTSNAEEQITDAKSRIKDTDIAENVMEQARTTVLSNVQEAMLSQIVHQPEKILNLLL